MQRVAMCTMAGQHQVSGGSQVHWLLVEVQCMFLGAKCVFSNLRLRSTPSFDSENLRLLD